MARHCDAQSWYKVGMMTQRIGRASEPLIIVAKKEVGVSQPVLCKENTVIQRAQSQCALMVVKCCLVVAQARFRPSTPQPSRHSVWIEPNCFLQKTVGQFDFIALSEQNKR